MRSGWLRGLGRFGRFALAGLALALAADSSCSYSPNFADGRLVCGDQGQCPKGYSCAADFTCAKTSAGSGDPALDAFVGSWSFATGTLTAGCSDGSSSTSALDPTDFIVIDRGGSGLLLRYFCDNGWTMTVDSSKTTASASPSNQTCADSFTDSSNVTTNYTWSNKSMTFSTADGLAATATGHIAGPFTASDNTSGTCDVQYSGALTKD